MKALSIGSDRQLFNKDSEAQKRIKEYGELFEELHIIVFSVKSDKRQAISISENVFVYPTNSRFKLFYIWNAYRASSSILRTSDVRRTSDVPKLKDWILTCQDPFESGLVGWFLKRRFKLPLQLQVHTDIFSPYFWQESWKNKLRVLLAKFLLPKANGIRVVSERIKNSLVASRQLLVAKISVLPIFVDVKKIQSAKIKTNLHQKYPEYDFIILMASRLTREKNAAMAIEAMRDLATKYKKDTNIRNPLLLIVGNGPECEALQKLIVKCQLSNVKIEPWTKDLNSYYKTADLFLLTSNYEGYGRTAVEAMAAGLPVIMTDVGLAGEILIDDLDGKVVPVGDAQAFAEAISELKENPAKREEFKQNSSKLLEKWPTKKEYLEKYKNLLMMLK